MIRSILILLLSSLWPMLSSQGRVVSQERPTVTTTRMVASDLTRVVRLPASVLPWESAALIPHVTGYVKRITLREGDWVELGEILAEIEVPLMSEDLARGEATLRAAAAQVDAAESDVAARRADVARAEAGRARTLAVLELRRRTLERVRQLRETNAATDEDLDKARGQMAVAEGDRSQVEADVLAAEAEVGAARARVEAELAGRDLAKAELDRLHARAELSVLRCPFEHALVVRRQVDPGALVRADETSVVVVMSLERVRVHLDVDERDAVYVGVGNPLTLTPDARGVPPHVGSVTRTSLALDPETRSMGVEIDVPNPDHRLRPGMFLHASLEVFRHADALTVPAEALQFGPRGVFVFVVEGGRLVARSVQTGIDDGLSVEIVSGLRVGEELVLSGANALREGAEVRSSGGTKE